MDKRTRPGFATASIIDHIVDLFEQYGAEDYGENATQLQHALQVAEPARRHGCTTALIAGALLHDIGQFMNDAGNAAETLGVDAHHEISGARVLEGRFPAAVSEPMRGPMAGVEIRAFEAVPFHADAVTLRRFDDAGKHPDWYPPDLASYRSLLESLLVRG